MSKAGFLETVDRVAPSASRDETRPVLTGVLIHFTKNQVRMVATDSYRLSVKETPVESSVPGSLQAIVPGQDSARTVAHSERRAPTTPSPSCRPRTRCSFRSAGSHLISRLIDGQFPNYRQLIPETFDYEVAVDHDELLEAVRRVGLLAQKNAPLRLRFADNTLTVSAESQDVGKAHEAMPVQYSGDDLEIGFNPEFLEAGVAAVKENTVYLRFISPLRPGLVKGGSDDFLYLVMPIRLSD